jgi:hypothetical protein
MDNEGKTKFLKDYYKSFGENGVALVGLNDTQGTPAFPWQKSLFKWILEALNDEHLKPIVIDAFSIIFNKSEHLESYIKHNVSTNDIACANYFGAISAMEKVGRENIPIKCFQKVLNLPIKMSKALYMKDVEGTNHSLTDIIKNTPHVEMILGTGSNDEMRILGSDSITIKKQYKQRHKTTDYSHVYEMATAPKTIPIVIDNIRKNIELILNTKQHYGSGSINLYILGQFVPESINKEEMETFRRLVIEFNILLEIMCCEYKINYIDQMKAKDGFDAHLKAKDVEIASQNIIDAMYENAVKGTKPIIVPSHNISFPNRGIVGVHEDVTGHYLRQLSQVVDAKHQIGDDDYNYRRAQALLEEREFEKKALEKVIQYTKK